MRNCEVMNMVIVKKGRPARQAIDLDNPIKSVGFTTSKKVRKRQRPSLKKEYIFLIPGKSKIVFKKKKMTPAQAKEYCKQYLVKKRVAE